MIASRNECSYVIRPSPLLVQTWSLPMGFKRLGSPRSSGFLLRFWLSKLTLQLLYAAQAWDCGPCASWTSPAANLSCLSIAHGDMSRFKIIQMINAQIAWQSMASSAEMADRLSKPCIFSEADISGMVEAKSLLMLTYLHFQPADGWATTCTRSPQNQTWAKHDPPVTNVFLRATWPHPEYLVAHAIACTGLPAARGSAEKDTHQTVINDQSIHLICNT